MQLCLSSFDAAGDGGTNDASALRACFMEAASGGGAFLVIEPGIYLVDTEESIPLCSHLSVRAYGATFLFPRELGTATYRRMFYGEDLTDVDWQGGHFAGYVYDPEREENLWGPSAYTGCIQIHTSETGAVKNIRVRDVTAENVAGAVVHVRGRQDMFAECVDIRDCNFSNCGKFMWDYGYLWQHAVFSDEYTPQAVANAFAYLPKAHISSELTLRDGRIYAEHMPPVLPLERDQITFFGDSVPAGTKRGKQYFVLNKGAENGLVLSETEGGEPLNLTEISPGTRLFRNMFYIFHDLFAPVGHFVQEKGSVDTAWCRHVTVSGCRTDASGDSMHILVCHNVVFSNNQITGSRMGAFYIGLHCKNVTVTGNTVYGTNGSRTMSVERSTEDITIVGNTFVGGGRGCWLNQPKNVIISDNIFIHNTQKCTPDIHVGRICQATGDYECYPELYFTTWQENAVYGPVIIRGNIIETSVGASAAVAFNPGGRDILMEGNVIRGTVREIHVASGCEMPVMANNLGMGNIVDHTFVNTANVR